MTSEVALPLSAVYDYVSCKARYLQVVPMEFDGACRVRLRWLLVNINTPTLGANRGPGPRHAPSATASVRPGWWQPLPLSRAVSPPSKGACSIVACYR